MKNINIPSYGVYALKKLNNAGFSAYIVGGFLRDSILSIPSYDIDIATNASINDLKIVFEDDKIIETGIRFSSLTLVVGKNEIQITSFRKDGKYSDNRHPDEVYSASSLKEDLIRRDFSINCLAYSLNEGLLDYNNSLSDLENKIIKTVGNSKQRFTEDPIRILRAIRFSIKLGFTIETNTLIAMRENAYLLQKIPSTRIFKEIFKILELDNAYIAILEFYDILSIIFPFLIAMKDFNQETPHHDYTLLNHTAYVVKNSKNDITLRLAALFHDVGKLYTKTIDNNNIAHFYSHQIFSFNYIKNFLYNKGINHKIIDNAAKIIYYHNDVIRLKKSNIKLLLNRLGKDLFFSFIDFKIADDISKTKNHTYNLKKYETIINLANEIIDNNECYTLKNLSINGNDLSIFNFEKTYIKTVLQNILQLVIDEKLENDKTIILEYIKNHYQ